jgi:hypothetical protein
MDDSFTRAKLLMTRIQRVQLKAEGAAARGDLDQVRELQREMEVLVDSMFNIREEQLLAELEEDARRATRPGWWRRFTRRTR